MTTKKTTKKPAGKSTPKADAELEAFAHHLAEVLRIARTHPDIPAQLYNDIAEAFNEFQNGTPKRCLITDSEAAIKIELVGGIAQRKAQKGGAK